MRPLVLAVSGGPDSLALMILAAENVVRLRALGFPLHIATVDHGLRVGSAAEAAMVARLAEACGLPHRTLAWMGSKPAGNLSAQARSARYRLLGDHAAALGAGAILTAHHEDDQIETHYLAAARGAGDRGLAGMRRCRAMAPGLWLLRPLLGTPGARLKATVAERRLAAVDDPSNRDPRFERARLRQALRLDPFTRRECLSRIARHAANRDAEDAGLARMVADLRIGGAFSIDEAGIVSVKGEAFRAAKSRLAHLFLARILRAAGGAEHAPSHAAVERLTARLSSRETAAGTLGGAAVEGGKTLTFLREYGRVGIESIEIQKTCENFFDRRLSILSQNLNDVPAGSRLIALGSLRRGNAVERTLPVLVDDAGRPIAAHPLIFRKLPLGIVALATVEQVSFRLFADLPPMQES